MKRLGWLVWAVFAFVVSTSAQENNWRVWVYDGISPILLDQTGAVLQQITLPVPAEYAPDTAVFSRGLAVSLDGNRLAYSVTGTDVTGAPLTTFIVFDVILNNVLMTYQPPISPNADALSLTLAPDLFSQTGGAVAYSYATGDDANTTTWGLLIFDVESGRTLAELNSQTPSVQSADLETLTSIYLLPVVQSYNGSQVSFSLVDYFTFVFSAETLSFDWDILTGRIIQTNQFPNLAGDTLSQTNETVSPIFDERINYTADPNYVYYNNAVHVFRPELGGRIPFVAFPLIDFQKAYFVEGGARILARADQIADQTSLWMLIERDGTARILPEIQPLNDFVVGTPDGFVYTSGFADVVLISADSRGESLVQSPVWVAPSFAQYVPVWAGYHQLPALPQFGPWAQLAPPLFAAQTVIVPDINSQGVSPQDVATTNARGNPNGTLLIGGAAIITTTDGDRLRMRSNPSLTGEIVARVENGALVVLLDGPVAADGFVWWQIRLTTGQSGWVVENADGVRTLTPAQ